MIREATVADLPTLERLAQRDSAILPEGRILIAEVGGQVRAAVTLDGKVAVADPFARTAELVALLRTRADQVARAERTPLRIIARTPIRPRSRGLSLSSSA